MIFSSSLACGDWLHMGDEAERLIDNGHSTLHIDIMDGHFVPNLCMTLDHVRQLKSTYPGCVIDAHLMVDNVTEYLHSCAKAGVDYCTFHYEAVKNHMEIISQIATLGMKPGMAINPETSPELVAQWLPQLKQCLVMAVAPGRSGQQFRPETYDKIATLVQMRKESHSGFLLSVDGGIDSGIGKRCRKLGADMLVMGMFTFFERDLDRNVAIRKSAQEIEAE